MRKDVDRIRQYTIILGPFNERHSLVVLLIKRFVKEDDAGEAIEGLLAGSQQHLPILTPNLFVVFQADDF